MVCFSPKGFIEVSYISEVLLQIHFKHVLFWEDPAGFGCILIVETFPHATLGGGFKYVFKLHPYLGKISNLTNIFQMG